MRLAPADLSSLPFRRDLRQALCVQVFSLLSLALILPVTAAKGAEGASSSRDALPLSTLLHPEDDSIMCIGALPGFLTPTYGFYGDPVSMQTRYTSLRNLCATTARHPQLRTAGNHVWNMGLECISYRAIGLRRSNGNVPMHVRQFKATLAYCEENCWCIRSWNALSLSLKKQMVTDVDLLSIVMKGLGVIDKGKGGSSGSGTGSESGSDKNIAAGGEGSKTQLSLNDLDLSPWTLARKGAGMTPAEFGQRLVNGQIVPDPERTGLVATSGECGLDCSGGNYRCEGGCHCVVSGYSVIAQGFTRWACMTALTIASSRSLNGRPKRDVERLGAPSWACPCNSSYVSQDCCDVTDGLIFEPTAQRVGMLVF